MIKEAKIVSVEYVPGGSLSAGGVLMYGQESGRPLHVGDTVTEEDGAVVVLRSARGAAIPTASIALSVRL